MAAVVTELDQEDAISDENGTNTKVADVINGEGRPEEAKKKRKRKKKKKTGASQ